MTAHGELSAAVAMLEAEVARRQDALGKAEVALEALRELADMNGAPKPNGQHPATERPGRGSDRRIVLKPALLARGKALVEDPRRWVPMGEVAAALGVSVSTAHNIARREGWRRAADGPKRGLAARGPTKAVAPAVSARRCQGCGSQTTKNPCHRCATAALNE